MTLLAAILTLAAATAPLEALPPAPPGAAALDGLESIEHIALPAVKGPLTLTVRALERTLVLEVPQGAAAALARRVRQAPRAVCPGLVEQREGEVRLTCRSRRIVARLIPRPSGALLEISETRGIPWDGLDGPPLVAWEPSDLELGQPCPGSTVGGRAECLIASGDGEAAKALLSEEGTPHAELRLGDLAYAAGDLRGAATHWARAHGGPWERVAAARLCELSFSCSSGAGAAELYAGAGLPPPLARELSLRRARVLAFLGQPLEAVQALTNVGPGVCSAAPVTCQRIVLLALGDPGPAALEGLALWVALPSRDRGTGAHEAEVAAAKVAEREGAPAFAANVLAAAVARVSRRALQDHLLRTAELYLAAEDRVRAGVVLDFARTRAGKKPLAGPRWAAVARGVAASKRPAKRAVPQDPDTLLAAADRAAQAARSVQGASP